MEQVLLELGLSGDHDHQRQKAALTRFTRAYEATGLIHQAWLALLQSRPQQQQQLLKRAYEANPEDRWIAFALADAALQQFYGRQQQADGVTAALPDEKRFLTSLLKIRNDHPEAVKRLWQLAEKHNDQVEVQHWQQRLRHISPYDADLATARR